ncbi:MAG: 30S ribosomal protein S19e [Candidatus Aenigmarchaeota archaeon]|nr:30S ribosomal protein S19e [Candidatus Aenigmarchaeota archaeon]
MTSAKDSSRPALISATAVALEKTLSMPIWAQYVKTGVSRERSPEQKNWWQLRSASILMKIYTDGPVGVEKLRTYYGGRHRRGHKPAHYAPGGGKIIRTILQDLEKSGYVQKADKKRGRIITPHGQKFLEGVAKTIRA